MYTFKSLTNSTLVVYSISIERNTNLCLFEQKFEEEEYPRYIRLTGQQIDKLKGILFNGNFSSHTIPVNVFELQRTGHISMRCPEEGQSITIKVEDLKHLLDYYAKHKERIERFDNKFRSRR